MTAKHNTLKATALLLLMSLGVFAYMAWQKIQMIAAREEHALKYAQLKDLLQNVAKLDRQIMEQNEMWKQAEKSGFFEPFSGRKFATKLKRMAHACNVQDIVLTFNPPAKALTKGSVHPVTVVLKAEWDQDVYKFVHRMGNEGLGLIHIREINLFRQPQAETERDVVHAEIRFDIMSIN